jgi:hypothetical protein
MANKNEDHLVQCPYYKTNTSQVVCCEGLEDGMAIHMAFATHQQLVNYKSRYCRRNCWVLCPLAKMQNERYEYE